jgi:hypothetical protein
VCALLSMINMKILGHSVEFVVIFFSELFVRLI